MSVFLLCEQAVGLVRGKRLILSDEEKANLETLNYGALTSAHAQDEAVVCALHFESVRDSLLEQFAWVFARKTETPAQLSENQTGWRYKFLIPQDCLKVLNVIAQDKRKDFYREKNHDLSEPPEVVELIEYEEIGEYVLTNRSPVYIRYTAKITDETKWATAFKDLFIIKLAEAIAPAVVGQTEALQLLESKANNLIQIAMANGLINSDTGLKKQRETMALSGINNLWLDYSGIPFIGDCK